MSTKTKNVLLVVNALTLGGAEAQALIMARALKKTNIYHPIVVGLTAGGPLENILIDEQIAYTILGVNFGKFNKNWSGKLVEISKAVKLIKKQNPQIIISSAYYPNVFIALCSILLFHVKVFWYQVGKEWDMPVGALQKLAQSVTKFYLANSNDVKHYMVSRLKIDAAKIRVITNVFLERLPIHDKKYWLQQAGLSENDFVFVLVSNFFKSKDQLTGVLAMQTVIKKHSNAKLVLAGFPPEPNYLNAIKAMVIDKKLYNHVVFLESTPDIFGLLQIANAGIFTSVLQHTEGSPTIIQEYMFAGLPTIVSNIPCNNETFEGIETALFYEPENPESLAAQMVFLLENRSFCIKAGTYNREKVEQAFTPDVLLNQLLSIFN